MDNGINCKEIREELIAEIKGQDLSDICGAFIQVGNNPASNTYVRNKIKLCEDLGIKVTHTKFDENIPEEALIEFIKLMNGDIAITGIMVQLPLPAHISEEKVINAISPKKDIDGFTEQNKGKLTVSSEDGIIPCTPKAIMTILEHINFDPKGKNVVIVGRSNIVGKPLANLLINAGATVTICNSSTSRIRLFKHINDCDLFISAIGKANYFNRSNLRGATLCNTIAIDVGINRDHNGMLCGDICKDVYNRFKAITPVPGGVGVMTVLEVVRNLIKCKE